MFFRRNLSVVCVPLRHWGESGGRQPNRVLEGSVDGGPPSTAWATGTSGLEVRSTRIRPRSPAAQTAGRIAPRAGDEGGSSTSEGLRVGRRLVPFVRHDATVRGDDVACNGVTRKEEWASFDDEDVEFVHAIACRFPLPLISQSPSLFPDERLLSADETN